MQIYIIHNNNNLNNLIVLSAGRIIIIMIAENFVRESTVLYRYASTLYMLINIYIIT